MDSQKANGFSPKKNGSQRRPPSYSVETPYGFHLDLDFLKYVDDIEKGNTIKRVPMQRRHRGRNNGVLSRNLSLPGYGCRSTQWNSISTLWPKTQLGDSQQEFDFHCSDGVSGGFARRKECIYKSEMDASIQAFDEQPLGCYVRPNLLRASSLPLTVLLRKHSTEDPTSQSSPKEYLPQENGSSEDVFNASDSRMGGANVTFQRLTAALKRVGELEAEIRVIPELKAQICILQEEREMLLLQLHSQNDTTGLLDVPISPHLNNKGDTPSFALIPRENKDQTCDDWMNQEYDRLGKNVKASSEQVDAVVTPSITRRLLPEIASSLQPCEMDLLEGDCLDNVDNAKSVTETLQRKVVILEQELHRQGVELDKTRGLLKQQVEESHLKDEKIKQLTIHLDIGCTVDRTTSPQNITVGTQNPEPVAESCGTLISCQEMPSQEATASQGLTQPPVSHADMEHHVKRLQELLQEQWECLCKDDLSGKISFEHLSPQFGTIQEQLVTLVTLLSHYVFPTGEPEPESKMEEFVHVVEYENVKRENLKIVTSKDSDSVEHNEEDFYLKTNINLEACKPLTSWKMDPTVQTVKNEDVKFNSKEDVLEKVTKKQKNLYKQTSQAIDEDQAISEEEKLRDCRRMDLQGQSEGNWEAVNKDFIAACCFLRDHMDKVSDPDDEMSKALTVVFQEWFTVSAEEDACADIVALYLNEVNSQTPAVLPFLVNMADDNGNTALHYSVSHSNFSIVKLLLDTGVCKTDFRNKSGYTAIMLAALTAAESPGDIKVLQQLMELGDINARVSQVGQTALHIAARHGSAPIARLLLAQGADPNVQDYAGTTPLISACDRGHINIVRILLEEANCDINLKDKGGHSALSLARQASHTEIADLLKSCTETKRSDKCKVS